LSIIIVQGSGIVTNYFGPFLTKQEAKKWAEESGLNNYLLVILMAPAIGHGQF
jgi:hypothetical protein